MPRRAHAVALPWIRVDRTMGIPAERQLSGALRQAIRQGLLQRGFRLPSIRQLALEVGVSRRVVANAYARLEDEGYLAATRGGATHVGGEVTRPFRANAIAASARALAMPALPGGVLAPGSVALDEFPWRRWQAGKTGLDLREIIATQVCPMRGIVATAEEIVLTTGREAALACAAVLLADPGDTVLVETPGDPRTRAIFAYHGLEWSAGRVDGEGLAFDATADAPRFIHVTPSRQYPSGVAMTLGRQFLLLQFARAVKASILEEDRDCEERALKASDQDGRVVYAGSFEKLLFPDVGIAFLVMPAELAAAAARIATPPPQLLQQILASFIECGELARHTRRMRAIYQERRNALVSALRQRVGDVTDGGALDLLVWLDRDADDVQIAAATSTTALSSAATAPGQLAPALIVGYGAVTPCNAPVAADSLAAAIDRAAGKRRSA
jgi:GntR family transcriptional regulator/MocR family aminotransferase